MVPSSCKKSTVGYEYLLSHRDTGSAVVAQVKKGEIDLDQSRYGASQQGLDRVFLFTTDGQYTGEGDDSVLCLQPESLTAFAEQYSDWMPPRIRFRLEQLMISSAALAGCWEEKVAI